jgi:hypothetical protein
MSPMSGPLGLVVSGIIAVVLVGGAVVVGHDAYCYVTYERGHGALCEREDGSTWRDPSGGCHAGNDPRCVDGVGCDDSMLVPEPASSSCGWILMKQEHPATAPPG